MKWSANRRESLARCYSVVAFGVKHSRRFVKEQRYHSGIFHHADFGL